MNDLENTKKETLKKNDQQYIEQALELNELLPN